MKLYLYYLRLIRTRNNGYGFLMVMVFRHSFPSNMARILSKSVFTDSFSSMSVHLNNNPTSSSIAFKARGRSVRAWEMNSASDLLNRKVFPSKQVCKLRMTRVLPCVIDGELTGFCHGSGVAASHRAFILDRIPLIGFMLAPSIF